MKVFVKGKLEEPPGSPVPSPGRYEGEMGRKPPGGGEMKGKRALGRIGIPERVVSVCFSGKSLSISSNVPANSGKYSARNRVFNLPG
ncbi:MAG TPA: hypothetical protein PLZ73_05025 [bacterium]|nr:hypothetical protein [bacterium]